jgi:hypothetical protein
MGRRGFAVLEIFLLAFGITVVAWMFSTNRGSDQNVQVAKYDNAAVDNTGKRPAPFPVWIDKKEGK